MPQNAEWRILAEEAAQENNPHKLLEIIEALTHALEEQHKKKMGQDVSVTLNIP